MEKKSEERELELMKHTHKMEELRYERETQRLKHDHDMELHRIKRADSQKLEQMKHHLLMESKR